MTTFILPPRTPSIVKDILTYHHGRVLEWIQTLSIVPEAMKQSNASNLRIQFVKNPNINASWNTERQTKKGTPISTLTLNAFYLEKLLQQLMTEHIKEDIMTRMAVRKINDHTSIIGVYAIRDIPANAYPFKTLLGHCFAENPTIYVKKDTPEIQGVRSFLDEFFLGTDSYPLPILGPNSINVSYFLNHSDTPNVAIVSVPECEYSVYQTTRYIRTGEELTINYNDFESKKLPFHTIQSQLDPQKVYLSLPQKDRKHNRDNRERCILVV